MIPSVVLVEDHTLVRSGIRSLLEKSSDVKVIGEASDGREALDLCRTLRPDVVLADVEMRNLNGIEAARQIQDEFPQTKVIMLSMHSDRQYVLESLRAGALGYVLKDAAPNELLTAIQNVAEGRRYLSPSLSDLVIEDYARRGNGAATAGELEALSPREREVLQLVAEGNSSAQIAERLRISIRTVDTHRFSLMRKLEIHSVAGLTKFAIANGLTSAK
jgi:DNA-binding NarL/FixJ family response regulator